MSETNNHPITEVMGMTMQKIKEMVDANTIIGEPIVAGDVTLVPVSKISIGFASGGSDFGKKKADEDGRSFGGGGGAGISITPVVFLVISGGNVKVLSVDSAPKSTADRVLDLVPQVIDKAENFMASHGKKDTGATE